MLLLPHCRHKKRGITFVVPRSRQLVPSLARSFVRSFVLGFCPTRLSCARSCWPAEVGAGCVRSCPQVRTVVLLFLCVCSYSVAQCERRVPLPISVLGQLPSASVGVVGKQRSELYKVNSKLSSQVK